MTKIQLTRYAQIQDEFLSDELTAPETIDRIDELEARRTALRSRLDDLTDDPALGGHDPREEWQELETELHVVDELMLTGALSISFED